MVSFIIFTICEVQMINSAFLRYSLDSKLPDLDNFAR